MPREQCAPAELFPDTPTAPADLAEVLPWEFLEYELAPYIRAAVEHIEQMMTGAELMHTDHIKRFAITKIDKDGYRVLAFANQGRNHFDTREAAEEHLAATKANNSEATLRSVYGDVEKVEVREVECYAHGDAVGIYFED